MKKEILLKITKNYVVIKNIEFYDEKNYNNERVARGELVFISTLTKSGYKLFTGSLLAEVTREVRKRVFSR